MAPVLQRSSALVCTLIAECAGVRACVQCVYILTSVVYFVNDNATCSVRDAPPSLQVEQVPWIHYNDDDVKPVDGPFSMDSNTIAADPGSLEMQMTHTPVLFCLVVSMSSQSLISRGTTTTRIVLVMRSVIESLHICHPLCDESYQSSGTHCYYNPNTCDALMLLLHCSASGPQALSCPRLRLLHLWAVGT